MSACLEAGTLPTDANRLLPCALQFTAIAVSSLSDELANSGQFISQPSCSMIQPVEYLIELALVLDGL
jgi:hypothetical protein